MFTQLKHRFDLWRRDRGAIRRLRYLDDHLLADIGVQQRGAIREFVKAGRGRDMA
jgi:uncharacterized protein YjiS (DUF1127 family)